MGDKITNRPQLVKVQDLLLLPQSRKAKIKARKAIKEIVPYIGQVAQLQPPEHSWSYEQLLELYHNGDLDDDFYTNTVDDEILGLDDELNGMEQILQEGESNEKGDAGPRDQQVIEEVPDRVVKESSDADMESDFSVHGDSQITRRCIRLDRMLDNPCIQAYPQDHTQVKLDAVQNLSTVFDSLYDDQGAELDAPPRDSRQGRSRRPRPSYVEFL